MKMIIALGLILLVAVIIALVFGTFFVGKPQG